MTQDPSSSLIGTIIADRYRIIRRVGEGGMGQVYEAEHIRMKRKSAIKVMRAALVGDPEALMRFTREAENASKLSHPNVASIFDFGETEDGLVYLAMEYIDGESLHGVLFREKAMHPAVTADIIGQAADALQAAHDLGILHRDLKPDNLMLSTRADGTYLVKLVDFGIARAIDSSATRVTKTGFAVGTPEYMSPEQLAGDVLDARSDEYALALVAFIMLTGSEAFGDTTGRDSFIQRLTSRPRRLAEVRPDIDWPVALQTVFDHALAPDPGDRYPNIAEFGNELANAISNMSMTQTSELYRRALDGRGVGVARRTPSADQISVPRTAAKAEKPEKAEKAERAKTQFRAATTVSPTPQVARPASHPRPIRRRRVPGFVIVVVAVYAVYWYGARQSGGIARAASNRIAAVSRAVAGPLMPYFNRIRRSIDVPGSSDTQSDASPATPATGTPAKESSPTPSSPAPKSPDAAAVAKPAAETPAPVKKDSARTDTAHTVKRDTTATAPPARTAPPDTSDASLNASRLRH